MGATVGVTVGGVVVGALVDGVVVGRGRCATPLDPPLQAPASTSAITTGSAHKALQDRGGRVDSRHMEAEQLYPELARVPLAPPAPEAPAAPDLAARVAELERVVATIASLRQERLITERPDPVALTAALHPGGMRSLRTTRRRGVRSGPIGLRVILFEQPTSR